MVQGKGQQTIGAGGSKVESVDDAGLLDVPAAGSEIDYELLWPEALP